MVSTRERSIYFHNRNLYDTITIPVRDNLLELTNDLELSVLLNQIIFSKKEKLTLNDIKTLSLNEKTKRTLRSKLEKLIELGLIRKYKDTGLIYNQYQYEPTEAVISNKQDILALIEGYDLLYMSHYETAVILNKFRSYALAGINEVHMSVRKLKSILGINISDSSVRNILKQLIQDDYLNERLVYGVYEYQINVSKITNKYNYEDVKRFSDEIFEIYKEYLKRKNLKFNKTQLNSHKMTISRMLYHGYNPNILKHIFIFITLNVDDFKDIVTVLDIKKSYNKLCKLSEALSTRKAKRFFYKLKNNLLDDAQLSQENNQRDTIDIENKQQSDFENMDTWSKAIMFIEDAKAALKKSFYTSLAGVTDIDFDDYYQESLKIAYEYFKKNKTVNKYTLSSIKFKLKDFMYKKRICIDNRIVSYEYEIDNLNLSTYSSAYSQDKNKNYELEFDTTLDNILNILDNRSQFIIKNYLGFNGISLTFKEIGIKLNLSESFIARSYKKAILLLRDHFPPHLESYLRELITKENLI